MINEKDINTGNKLFYITGNESIEALVNWKHQKHIQENPKNFNHIYKPIIITEELLDKSVLLKDKQKHQTWGLTLNGISFEVKILPDTIVLLIQYIIPIKLKGWHHLQNIIYYLTGKEI